MYEIQYYTFHNYLSKNTNLLPRGMSRVWTVLQRLSHFWQLRKAPDSAGGVSVHMAS